MSNPFHNSFEDAFRGQRVVAESDNGAVYTGLVERLHHHDHHIVLRSAHRGPPSDPGPLVGRAFIASADRIEIAPDSQNDARTERIERVKLDTIRPSPYACREFDARENRGYINAIERKGQHDSFPIVRVNGESPEETGLTSEVYDWEVLEGHKRFWVAQELDFEAHPVEIVECTDWEAAERFCEDHLPDEDAIGRFDKLDDPEQVSEKGSRARKTDDPETFGSRDCYNDEEVREAIERLHDRRGSQIDQLPAVGFNVERLGIELVDEQTNAHRSRMRDLHSL
jgi:hypothetical protein